MADGTLIEEIVRAGNIITEIFKRVLLPYCRFVWCLHDNVIPFLEESFAGADPCVLISPAWLKVPPTTEISMDF